MSRKPVGHHESAIITSINDAAKLRGIRQVDLAKGIRRSQSAISRFLAREYWSEEIAAKLCEFLDIDSSASERKQTQGRTERKHQVDETRMKGRKCVLLFHKANDLDEQLQIETIYRSTIDVALKKVSRICKCERRALPPWSSHADSEEDIYGEDQSHMLIADIVIVDISTIGIEAAFSAGLLSAMNAPLVLVTRCPHRHRTSIHGHTVIDLTSRSSVRRLQSAFSNRLSSFPKTAQALKDLLIGNRSALTSENSFKDQITAWRINRIEEQVKAISSGNWNVPTQLPIDFSGAMFTGVIQQLLNQQCYWTMTNSSFWISGGISKSAFLMACVDAATRGVEVKRCFVLSDEVDKSNVQVHDLMKVHFEAEMEARKRLKVLDLNANGKGSLHTRVLWVKQEEYIRRRSELGHYGVAFVSDPALKDVGGFVVEPRYDSVNTIRYLDFTFSRGPARTDRTVAKYINQFEESWRLAVDISELVKS